VVAAVVAIVAVRWFTDRPSPTPDPGTTVLLEVWSDAAGVAVIIDWEIGDEKDTYPQGAKEPDADVALTPKWSQRGVVKQGQRVELHVTTHDGRPYSCRVYISAIEKHFEENVTSCNYSTVM
jgi:hypothetical protein